MAVVQKSIVINAPWERVNEVATDGNRLHEWFEGLASSQSDGTFPEAGGKVEAVYKAAGVSFNLTMTSTEYRPGEVLNMTMEGMLTGTQNWGYNHMDEQTEVYCTFDYQVPGGGLGAIADKLVVERVNSQNLEKSLENLKKLIEM